MKTDTLGPATLFLAVVSLIHIWLNLFSLASLQVLALLHFAALSLVLLVHPAAPRTVAGWLGRILISVVPAAAALVLLGQQDAFHQRGMEFSSVELFCVAIVILAGIYFAGRNGLLVSLIIVAFMSYALIWGKYIDGPLGFPGLSLETVLFRSVYTDDGMFGSIAGISASFVFMFILFGAFLVRSGAGDFIIEMAQLVAGRITGGPGLVAVGASAMTGTVSGSAVANTVTTGVVTIPLMKRSGFPASFAAAVEASASTGGQLMPPVMGAGAFLIASYTQSDYSTIIALSMIPALLFFFAIAFNVGIEAQRLNLKLEDDGQPRPSFWQIVRRRGASFIVAMVGLIWLLVAGFTPVYASGIAICLVVAASWLTENPMGPRQVILAFADGARNAAMIGLLLVAIGLVVNVLAMTGLGATFSLFVVEWAGGNLLIALVLVAVASLILGMGLPVTAAYVVLATLCAPALTQIVALDLLVGPIATGTIEPAQQAVLALLDPHQTGTGQGEAAARDFLNGLSVESQALLIEQLLDPARLAGLTLAAHLAIFWLSQDSNVTPPVCLTAYAAAAIAESHPLRTGFMAWKISKPIYLMPIAFFTTPILSGDPMTMLWGGAISLCVLVALIVAIEGYLLRPVNPLIRAALCGAGVICLLADDPLWRGGSLGIIVLLVGLCILLPKRPEVPRLFSI